MSRYSWKKEPPEYNGEYFYSGKLPGEETEILAIINISRNPGDGLRWASIFIPPGWREDETRTLPIIYARPLEEWPGLWAGPEHGLTCVQM